LDRVVACLSWSRLFTWVRVQHIASSHSDHCPILLEVEKDGVTKASQ
jgi:hypothetical protein